MLMAHPAVLRNLVEQYDTLRILQAENGDADVQQRMDDIAYTLCVSTGTRDIDAALVAARHQLPGARPQDDSVLTG
ncbi:MULTISPECIES: DUF5133 domain-containing protein [Streptomyces]|uniref:DUF5133 domain-containing protein n=1 Tax=Streptomyces TaxID=1883 RepID=UPI00136ADC33|nr:MULTISPECIES: DUF5133 domain-containing protein [unclassified Streptomyces]MYT55593.1 DUF5133 domain-containing protein [Streptomyces sp. SID7834]MDX2618315.1 DUF5133 domain-containing protein [Streptomyces sp. WI03-5b]MDX3186328.1 DUF5133 domain-containing protein [Streptomyces sp. ME02-7008A-1]MDX3306959.1 DUF5133 domain-containing protein [Streptomyces sp. ME02-7008A]MEE1778936.1 DUF5133 domain-containing protein [Streptomyces sp. JV181]